MSSSPQPEPQPQPQPQSPPPQSPPPSPPTTAAITTTTTSTPPPPPPPIIQALSYSPLKKPQPIPWSHEETLNLIKAYQEKWYSLKRGQLKASQWEEVAITVAARCGLDDPSKSGTQCRHKIEKLRKRYRAEKQKMGPNFNYHNHPWIYFSLMDQLERGPLPISAIAPADNNNNSSRYYDVNGNNNSNHYVRHGSDDDDEEGGGVRFGSMEKLRRDLKRGFGRRGGDFGGLNKRKSYWEGDDDEVGFEDGDEEVGGVQERENGRNFMAQLGAQFRGFAENFVRIEKKKLDFMRDNQRLRIEMESKKREMILVYQHKTIQLINKAFTDASAAASSSQKKMKMMSPDL
ncbi:trihelix transcription factor ASIL1-like [Chenopodium quinoa]|uniref:trihelix transcription factor ASIL1-like n=1 Tax=Chenopodium quinoa TaxID=63459 RepID=UPI000B77886E|nr:trihelix transcription factor ASIL1-like [Chenopodium quinoa]